MYGDTAVIRAHARRLTEQAGEIRIRADRLVRSAQEVLWDGRAALAMQDRMRERAAALARTADAHEQAAAALRTHADAVDEVKARIEEIARRVRSLVSEARSRLAGVVEGGAEVVSAFSDRTAEWWAGFREPPQGHRDWLDFAETIAEVRR